MPSVPIDDWLRSMEEGRAHSSRLGQSVFALPKSRAPTEEERRDAELANVQEAARETGWRRAAARRTGRGKR